MLERVNNFGLWWERLQDFWIKWAFLYSEDDNNYIISMTIFDYNPKLPL